MKRDEGLSGPEAGGSSEWFDRAPVRVPVTRKAPVAQSAPVTPAAPGTEPQAFPDAPEAEAATLPGPGPGGSGGSWEGAPGALPRRAVRAYWLGLTALVIGLVAVMASLATHVTSIVQTVLLASPLVLVGIGLERVGRGVGRGSLRGLGAAVIVIAVVSPVALSLSKPGSQVSATVDEQVPAGAADATLQITLGGGQLHVGSGAPGLLRGELLSPGQPSTEISTSAKTAVVALAGPRQHGLLARNRGSDWVARVPVALQVSSGLIDIYVPTAASFEVRVKGFVKGLVQSNFGSQGLVLQGGAWRTPGESTTATFVIDVRITAGRVRLHRV